MKIDYLANHPALIVKIAEWNNSEWPWYYDNGDFDTAVAYHTKTAQIDSIPCALVALDKGELAGTIAIIEQDMEIRSELAPWLGCLYVAPAYRSRGLASHLIKEGEILAKKFNFQRIYTWTETLKDPLLKNGWHHLECVDYQGKKAHILSLSTS